MTYQSPFFSLIIILTQRNASLLSFTLKSIEEQAFAFYEVILIHSLDKEPSLSAWERERCHVVAILSNAGSEGVLRNRGISFARGKYVHFLDAGEFYLSSHSLEFLKEFTAENVEADLIYTGCIQRHSLSPPQQIFRQIDRKALRAAKIPPALSSYWFKRMALLSVGRFSEKLQCESGYDLLCRFYRRPILSKLFMRRILTDYEYRTSSSVQILCHFAETFFVMVRHFGLSSALVSWALRNQWRLLKWWGKYVRGVFWRSPTGSSSS